MVEKLSIPGVLVLGYYGGKGVKGYITATVKAPSIHVEKDNGLSKVIGTIPIEFCGGVIQKYLDYLLGRTPHSSIDEAVGTLFEKHVLLNVFLGGYLVSVAYGEGYLEPLDIEFSSNKLPMGLLVYYRRRESYPRVNPLYWFLLGYGLRIGDYDFLARISANYGARVYDDYILLPRYSMHQAFICRDISCIDDVKRDIRNYDKLHFPLYIENNGLKHVIELE